MADENITIGVDLKDDFTGPARRVVNSIDDIGDSARSSRPELDLLEGGVEGVGDESVKTAVKARTASKRIREMGNEALKTAGKMKILSAVTSRLDRLNRMGGGPGVGGGGGGGKDGGTGKYIKAGFQFRGLRIAMIIAAIASVIPSVVAGISALGAAVMGLAGALGPLTGLIVAYPGYLAAFGQAFAAVKMSLSGLGEAVKTSMDVSATAQELRAAKNEFSSLGGNFAGQFVRNIAVAMRELDGMKGAIQQAFLPALNNLINAGRNLFPIISAGLTATGAALGDITNKFAAAINNTGFAKQLSQIMSSNVEIISNFGDAAISGFKALMEILVAAGPMLTQISADISSMFQTLSSSIGGAGASGALSAFFQETYAVAKQVLQIFWDIGVALKNIAAIGAPLGKEILGSFSAIAEEFRSFTESEEGVKSIGQWFTDMRPVIYEMGYLIRDVAQALMSLSRPDQATLILKTLRTDALPVITSLIQNMGDLLPSFLSLAVSVLKVVDAIMKMAPLEGFITVIAFVIEGIANLLEAIASGPLAAVGTAIMTVITAVMGLKILGVVFAIFSKLVIGFVSTITTLGGVLGGASGGAMTLGSALSALTGPIGWVVAAIIGLIALLITMWNSSEAFRNGVVNAFNTVRDAITSAIDMIRGKLEEHAESINFVKNAFVAVVDFIGTYLVPLYGQYLAGVIQVVAGYIGMMIDVWGSYINAIKIAAQITLMAAAAILRGIGDMVENALSYLSDFVTGLAESFGWLPGGIGEALQLAAIKLKEFTSGTKNNFENTATALENGARAVGNWSMAAADGVDDLSESVDELALSTQAATNNLQKLNGWLEMLGSNASWRNTIMDLESGIKEGLESGELSFKRFTEAGEKNLGLLRSAVDATLDKVTTLYEGGNVEGALRVLNKRIGYLKDIMELVPPEMRGPFEKMLAELQTQKRRFERQVRAMMDNPIQAEVPVELKMKADIRTPSTGDIPQSVLQGLPDISSGQSTTIQVDTSQVDTAKTKVDELNTQIDSIGAQSIVISVTGLVGLQSAATIASRLSSTLQTMPKTVNINVPVISIQTAITLADRLRQTVMEIPSNVPISVDQSQLNSAYTTANNLYNKLQNMPRDITVTITVNVTGDEIPAGAGAMGGPVPARTPWLIGELGPEMFVSNSGMTRMIGMHGPEVMNFPTSGTIIPNHLLPEKEAANAIAGEVRATPSRSSEYMSNSGGGYSINIGTINAQSEIDVVRAVKKGIAEAERNRRERS